MYNYVKTHCDSENSRQCMRKYILKIICWDPDNVSVSSAFNN